MTALAPFLAGGAAALTVFLLLYFPDQNDGSGAALGAFAALIAVPLGLAALAKERSLPGRSAGDHLRFIPIAVGLGIGLGVANLLANYGMAVLVHEIYEQMITRWSQFHAWSVVIAGPIMEEIAFRLVLMGALAWIAARVTSNRRTIATAALGLSSLMFGVAHIGYGGLPYSMLCHSTANAIHLVLMPALFSVSMDVGKMIPT